MTILKVSEKNFEDSPVNRTKMIEMILFVLYILKTPAIKTYFVQAHLQLFSKLKILLQLP